MPTNQKSSRISAGDSRALGASRATSASGKGPKASQASQALEAADGKLLDQDARTPDEPAGEHEAEIVGERDDLLEERDDIPRDGELFDRARQLALLDPVPGEPQRELTGHRVDGVQPRKLLDVQPVVDPLQQRVP